MSKTTFPDTKSKIEALRAEDQAFQTARAARVMEIQRDQLPRIKAIQAALETKTAVEAMVVLREHAEHLSDNASHLVANIHNTLDGNIPALQAEVERIEREAAAADEAAAAQAA